MRFNMKTLLHEDRGDAMVGAVVGLAIWSFALGAAMLVIPHSMEASRTATNYGMATNIADAEIKKARTVAWADLGTNGDSANLLPSGYTKVQRGKLAPSSTQMMREVPMAVKTSVGVEGSGAKMIAVEVTWENQPSGQKHIITQSAILSPPVDTANPTNVPLIGE